MMPNCVAGVVSRVPSAMGDTSDQRKHDNDGGDDCENDQDVAPHLQPVEVLCDLMELVWSEVRHPGLDLVLGQPDFGQPPG
jgi:hypothetical protein